MPAIEGPSDPDEPAAEDDPRAAVVRLVRQGLTRRIVAQQLGLPREVVDKLGYGIRAQLDPEVAAQARALVAAGVHPVAVAQRLGIKVWQVSQVAVGVPCRRTNFGRPR